MCVAELQTELLLFHSKGQLNVWKCYLIKSLTRSLHGSENSTSWFWSIILLPLKPNFYFWNWQFYAIYVSCNWRSNTNSSSAFSFFFCQKVSDFSWQNFHIQINLWVIHEHLSFEYQPYWRGAEFLFYIPPMVFALLIQPVVV